MECADTIAGQQPAGIPTRDPDSRSLNPNILCPQVGQASIQQETVIVSSKECAFTAKQAENGVVSTAGSCYGMTTSNINKMDQVSSSKQFRAHDVIIRDIEEDKTQDISFRAEDSAAHAMEIEKTVAIEGDDVILSDEHAAEPCYTLVTLQEIPSDLRANETNAASMTNMGCNSSQNARLPTTSIDVDSISGKIESPADASEGNGGACMSDEATTLDVSLAVPDMRDTNLERSDNSKVCKDGSFSASKDEPCDLVRSHAVAER